MNDKIPIAIEDEMRQSYMDYAMSVIIGRALPVAADGLKPVHRRVLYAMLNEGLVHNKRYSKCAGVVGEVLKRYHPHGDMAVYDALVRLAQPWNVRYPLIDGQGNFGSVDGDPAAAYRYTECRLTRIAEELLADIEKDTVDHVPNFDDSTTEPVVLPTRIPNLLVNGSSGIAVGMTTNIPPHNLGEVIDGLVALIENPKIGVDELMQHIPGPDFPTAGFLHGRAAIREAYTTGRGVLRMRAKTHIETDKKGTRESIIVTELPYQVNKAKLIERIAELVNEKRIDGISDVRDESDREGMRMVVDLKRDAISDIVLNQLFKLTPMQESFGVIMLAIVGGRPKLLTLRDALQVFIDHRKDVVRRRTVFELRKAQERLHILEGFKIALDNLDAVIALIRAAADPATAKAGLIATFGLSAIQAQAILEMRLQRLTNMERDKILEEHAEVLKQIARYKQILGDEREVMKIIVAELNEVKEKYADERRTQIVAEEIDISVEDLIPDEDMVVTVSHQGYVKRSPVTLYRSQKRGGRGRIGAVTKEEDFVENLFVASTHSYILFFTTDGKLFWLKVHELPQAGAAARGKAVVNLLNLKPDEKISAFLPVKEFVPERYVFFATKQGTVKKTALEEYANPRPSGIIAIKLNDGDEVIGVRLTDGKANIVLSTHEGQACRFNEDDVRPMGRSATGVRGVQLDENDYVVAVDAVTEGATLLTVARGGYGKRTPLDDYRLTRRGGKGVATLKVTEKTGQVVWVHAVADEDDIMIITDGGKLIRTPVKGISVIGRNTQGVRLIDLNEGENVVSVAIVADKVGGPVENGDAEAEGSADVPVEAEGETATEPTDSDDDSTGE